MYIWFMLYTYIYVYIYIHIYLYIHICTYVYTHIYVYIYIHFHLYIYIHAYMHRYKYKHGLSVAVCHIHMQIRSLLRIKSVETLWAAFYCNTLHVSCIILQHILQHTTYTATHNIYCNTLHRIANTATHNLTGWVRFCLLNQIPIPWTAIQWCCSVLQCVAVCAGCHTATHCNILTALRCNALQRTASHCNTLQHTHSHVGCVSWARS